MSPPPPANPWYWARTRGVGAPLTARLPARTSICGPGRARAVVARALTHETKLCCRDRLQTNCEALQAAVSDGCRAVRETMRMTYSPSTPVGTTYHVPHTPTVSRVSSDPLSLCLTNEQVCRAPLGVCAASLTTQPHAIYCMDDLSTTG